MNQNNFAFDEEEEINENMNNNQDLTFFYRLSPNQYKNILFNIIPCMIYIFLITSVLFSTYSYCDISINLILKTLLLVYTGFILKTLFNLVILKLNKENLLTSKISISSCDMIIYTSYYISVFLLYNIYIYSPNTCLRQNIDAISLCFILLLTGLINFSQEILNIIFILACFPIMVYYFMKNPQNFYSHYGIDPEIVNNLPTKKAEPKHCINCVICTEDIKLGDEIIVLKCPGHHAFHASCIKSWLLVKVACPMCRSENIL